jgi:ribosomal protein L7/L12
MLNRIVSASAKRVARCQKKGFKSNKSVSLFAATSTRLYSNSPHSTPLSELAADIKPNGLQDIVPPSNNPSDPIGVSPRVSKLVDDLMQLTVAEMIAFGNELQKRTGISPSQMYSAAPAQAAPQAAAQADAAPAKDAAADKKDAKDAKGPQQSKFDVKLLKFKDGAKFTVLKEIRRLKPGMSLMDSKPLVEDLPKVIASGLPAKEAEEWKKDLIAIGAEVELA